MEKVNKQIFQLNHKISLEIYSKLSEIMEILIYRL